MAQVMTPRESYMVEDEEGKPRFFRAGSTRLSATHPAVQANPHLWEPAGGPSGDAKPEESSDPPRKR